ncbi:glycogen-binding domain-containing protein [Yeosuana sp. MJ-SS3]|uniref:Glycogen-binding domain-containing protein n=1 Tax=Gilvirhabdus luticola TaxID=3079858 RepID=A0ABU3U8W1_9FLAO|nr:glycogen-binding domain-containing protein [Yeosuana sp. MJ-SS3]MDU8886854.1 glycogen-binding domain-containing protein [Yeosuana sp. MJ-SS3]
MKKIITYTTCLIIVLLTFTLNAQKKEVKGYTIQGDSVVFTFDIRDYKFFTDEYSSERLEFDDLNLKSVAVSGEFNLWSRDKWKMKQVDQFTYQLTKKISDFSDAFSWEFKFVINEKFWAEPTKNASNIAPAKDVKGENLYVYNLKMFSAYPDENGNACFKLRGFENAKKVILSGTFNRWSENQFMMHKTENGWEVTLHLRPGEYEYRFIIDGHWIEDPDNPSKRENEFDEYNSLISIEVPVTFHLNGYLNANKVILAGSFNDWSESDYIMTKVDNGWTFTTDLSGGKHHYKYIIDGNWIVDPDNKIQEYDGEGNINSVLMVK